MNLNAFEFLLFDSAREPSNDVNTFLNLRFIKKQKPAGAFLRKYSMLTHSNIKVSLQNLKQSSCNFKNSL